MPAERELRSMQISPPGSRPANKRRALRSQIAALVANAKRPARRGWRVHQHAPKLGPATGSLRWHRQPATANQPHRAKPAVPALRSWLARLLVEASPCRRDSSRPGDSPAIFSEQLRTHRLAPVRQKRHLAFVRLPANCVRYGLVNEAPARAEPVDERGRGKRTEPRLGRRLSGSNARRGAGFGPPGRLPSLDAYGQRILTGS